MTGNRKLTIREQLRIKDLAKRHEVSNVVRLTGVNIRRVNMVLAGEYCNIPSAVKRHAKDIGVDPGVYNDKLNEGLKFCRHCRKWVPEESIHQAGHKWCKPCTKAARKAGEL